WRRAERAGPAGHTRPRQTVPSPHKGDRMQTAQGSRADHRRVPAEAVATASPAGLRLSLLNGFRLPRDDRLVVLPRAAERLVAYVALTGTCSRAQVAGTLWADMRYDQALACLRSALWRLRRLCRGTVRATAVS